MTNYIHSCAHTANNQIVYVHANYFHL